MAKLAAKELNDRPINNVKEHANKITFKEKVLQIKCWKE